jgi:hypothetical protein
MIPFNRPVTHFRLDSRKELFHINACKLVPFHGKCNFNVVTTCEFCSYFLIYIVQISINYEKIIFKFVDLAGTDTIMTA